MKSKEQVKHFIHRKKFKSKIDFDVISSYCKNIYGLKLHVPSSYYPDSEKDEPVLDYVTFINWIEHGFGAGDAVKWDDFIGLVQRANVDSVEICLRIDGNGPNFDLITLPVQVITLAGENALKRLKMALYENDKEFGNPFFLISEKFKPGMDNFVKFSRHFSDQEAIGVVKNIDANNEVYMYCYFWKGTDEIKYGMNEHIGNWKDFVFTEFKPTDYERKLLEQELGKVGKTWNHYLKRIEPVNMRVKAGEKFWYISDKWNVVEEVDNGKGVCHKRYLAGNYFNSAEDAFLVMRTMKQMREEMLARPEEDLTK